MMAAQFLQGKSKQSDKANGARQQPSDATA
jgi:hypothetical protein